jgi:hypothetical protein
MRLVLLLPIKPVAVPSPKFQSYKTILPLLTVEFDWNVEA